MRVDTARRFLHSARATRSPTQTQSADARQGSSTALTSPHPRRAFQRISNDKLVAFEVNSDFYLEAQFKKNCKLVRIDVSPKNFSQHLNPEGKEVDFDLGLTEEEYTQLLARINEITPLGRLMHKGKICPVTNSTCWMRDDYASLSQSCVVQLLSNVAPRFRSRELMCRQGIHQPRYL